MRVFLSSLGCKLNQAEGEALARRFLACGHVVVGSLAEADLHVVNSCTVTRQAARDSRKTARRGARLERHPRTVLTGCWATAEPAAARDLEGVDLVVGNADKDRLVELAADLLGEPAPAVPVSYVPLELGTARALVKVEDGCDMRCAFCIIPTTRGAQRSRPLAEIAAEVSALEAGGYREIVLTGVQISAYRDGGARLPALVDAALAATSECRFRLTSIAPWELDHHLLDRLGHPRLCRHLHLSLQSGDDRTLRRMRRPYTAAGFAAVVAEARRRVPGVAVTTDVITGFPGETDQEAASSVRFVEAMSFAKVHVFAYSPRAGTEAATLPAQVGAETARARTRRMLAAAEAADLAFRRGRLGGTAHVLWETRRDGLWAGTSDDYLRVFAPAAGELRGRVTAARITELRPAGVLGETAGCLDSSVAKYSQERC